MIAIKIQKNDEKSNDMSSAYAYADAVERHLAGANNALDHERQNDRLNSSIKLASRARRLCEPRAARTD
jgi:hypothetical protein